MIAGVVQRSSRDRIARAKLAAFLEATREWYRSVVDHLDGESSPHLTAARMKIAGRQWAEAESEARRGR